MKFSALINRTASIVVPYRNDEINVTFFTEKLTPTYKAQLLKMADEQADLEAEVRMLADLIQTWDVLGEDDEPVPVTYEFLLQCPYAFLAAVAQAIQAHITDPNPQKPASQST